MSILNTEAAEALYDAERRGVRQIKGSFADEQGGRCAYGVLMEAGGMGGAWLMRGTYPSLPALGLSRAVCHGDIACPACGQWALSVPELIAHLNDHHEFTFAEIARKLGPDSA